jgi:ABC-2 type transport system permease protein
VNAVRKYWAFARIAAVEAATERGDLYGRALFFAVILGVFSALWRAVAEAGMPLLARQDQLVWYLATTEWILLSTPQRQLEIQEDVRRGDIAYQLPRPVVYPRATLAQCLGTLVVRAPLLGAAAFGCAFAFTGRLPDARALLFAVPFGLLASAVLAELYVALGLLSFWLTDATPLYWVAGKLVFILGGLMLPLELYPRWLQLLARCTPFPSLLAGPAGFLIHAPGSVAAGLALRLLLWALLLFGLVELLFWRATRALQLNGG